MSGVVGDGFFLAVLYQRAFNPDVTEAICPSHAARGSAKEDYAWSSARAWSGYPGLDNRVSLGSRCNGKSVDARAGCAAFLLALFTPFFWGSVLCTL